MVWVYTLPAWEYPRETLTLDQAIKKAAGPHGFITPKDLDLLDSLYYRRFLLTKQIGDLFYSHTLDPVGQAGRRMKILFDRGMVLRFRPIVSKHEGTHQFIYALSQLGYDFLVQVRKREEKFFDEEPRWQETNNVVEMSRLLHELELNEFSINVSTECFKRNLEFEWHSTRLSWHKVSPKQSGVQAYIISPDAVLRIGKNLFHIEYERSADPDRFLEKLKRWIRYRKERAWKERWLQEPTILVVGNLEPGKVEGKSRRERSIAPLIKIARENFIDNIFFLYNENWKSGCWSVYNGKNEKFDIFNLVLSPTNDISKPT